MNTRQLVIGSLVVVAAVAALWWSGTAENPIRGAMREGWIVSREHLSPEGRPTPITDPLEEFANSLVEPPGAGIPGRTYVPAYAQIRLGSGRGKLDLATTLSIHNSSVENPIVIRKVSYHGTDGSLVETFLDHRIGLKPLATIEFFVAAADLRAGSGANFLVEWETPITSRSPIAEAVMIGTIGTTSYSFVSQGRSETTRHRE